MKKRFLVLLLCAAATLALAACEELTTGGPFVINKDLPDSYFQLYNDGAEYRVGWNLNPVYNRDLHLCPWVVNIPAEHNGKPVTQILNFLDERYIVKVTIPEGVTSIGDGAFSGCSRLADITIPSSVTYIGGNAFDNTPWLNAQPDGLIYINNILYKYKETTPQNTAINIRDGTTAISDYAFSGTKYGGTSITGVTIPSSVKSIGNDVFKNCTSLTNITIPEGVTSIGYYTFEGCKALASVTIPSSVKSIGNDVFKGCTSLTNITIPDGITAISNYMFEDCKALTSVTIPSSVRSIGMAAFKNCTALTNITIPEGVTSINVFAFQDCTSLTNITIPSTLTYAASPSSGHPFLNTPWYNAQPDGLVYFNNLLYTYKGNIAANAKIDIRNGTTSINSYAFSGQKNVYFSVTIPEGVTSIGVGAFKGCKLTSVTIPSSVTVIRDNAFEECNFHSVTIPEGVTVIGDHAFYYCAYLDSVTVPSSVTVIHDYAFDRCYLKSVTFQGVILGENLSASSFEGDLRDKYLAGGIGTYTSYNNTWTKK